MTATILHALTEGRVLDAAGLPIDGGEAVERIGNLVAATGLGARQAIGVCFENGATAARTYAALQALDAVAVPLPPTMPAEQRLVLWRQAGCRHHTDGQSVTAIPDAAPAGAWPKGVLWLMHSSGSTGLPKPIPLTLDAVSRNAQDTMTHLGLSMHCRHMGSMSMCYTNGLYNSFLLPVLTGGTAVVVPVAGALSFRAWLSAARANRPELLWVNPAVVKMLLRQSADSLPSPRMVVSCTAPLSLAETEAAQGVLGVPVLQSYGLTETLIVTIERPGRPLSEFSAGLPLGGGDAIRRGEDGRLIIANGAVTPGYAEIRDGTPILKLEEGTPGQEFVSSDIVDILFDGRCVILGRSSATVNVEGVKISAEALEAALTAHPAVQAAGVAAIPDPRAGERPVAVLVLEAGQGLSAGDHEDLARRCVDVAGVKARPVAFHAVEQLPQTSNGKVDRIELQRLVSDLTKTEKIDGFGLRKA